MSRLREGTASQHTQLEEAVAIGQQFQSRASYRVLLEKFHGFVKPIEELLARYDWHSVGLNFSERRKVALLEQDLAAVGSSPTSLEHCECLPHLPTMSHAFGALYVMEGSTLGGQHISRMANEANIGIDALNYFRSYGDRVGEMWREFGAALNRFAEDEGDDAEMMQGARETFDSFRNWFLRKTTIS